MHAGAAVAALLLLWPGASLCAGWKLVQRLLLPRRTWQPWVGAAIPMLQHRRRGCHLVAAAALQLWQELHGCW